MPALDISTHPSNAPLLGKDVAFTGTADTWPVLAGDRCEIDIEFLNWTAKEVLVLESNDQSSEESADERTFTVQEWTMD